VLDKLATFSRQPLLYFSQKPRIIIQKSLNGFLHKCLRILATFSRQPRKFSLQIQVQIYFHILALLLKLMLNRVPRCTRTSPLPLLPSGPGGVGGIALRGTRPFDSNIGGRTISHKA